MAIQQGSNVTVTHQIVINGQVAFEANDVVNVESISPNPQSPQHKYTVFSTRLNQRFSLSDSDIREATVPLATPPVAVTLPVAPPPVRSPKPKSGKTAGDHWRELPTVGKVLLVIGIIVVLAIIVGVAVSGTKTETTKTETPSVEEPAATPSETPATEPAPTPAPAPAPAPAPSGTVSQQNALAKAKDYLSNEAFSHDGLVEQLEYEQFSQADAVYGADNCGADWNQQAAKKAQEYMGQESFSRGSLIEQLLYEKFTQAQSEYGASAFGL